MIWNIVYIFSTTCYRNILKFQFLTLQQSKLLVYHLSQYTAHLWGPVLDKSSGLVAIATKKWSLLA